MARKVKSPKEIVLECCEGSRGATGLFSKMNDDAFIGYQTAMVKILNPNIDASSEQLFDLITDMVKNKEL